MGREGDQIRLMPGKSSGKECIGFRRLAIGSRGLGDLVVGLQRSSKNMWKGRGGEIKLDAHHGSASASAVIQAVFGHTTLAIFAHFSKLPLRSRQSMPWLYDGEKNGWWSVQ